VARQRRCGEHLIRDEGDFARHVDSIHCNPVKHGQVTRAADCAVSLAGFYSFCNPANVYADDPQDNAEAAKWYYKAG